MHLPLILENERLRLSDSHTHLDSSPDSAGDTPQLENIRAHLLAELQ
jgi:hypothetical protein